MEGGRREDPDGRREKGGFRWKEGEGRIPVEGGRREDPDGRREKGGS